MPASPWTMSPAWRCCVMARSCAPSTRRVVGWKDLLNCPWHLIDIAPYRDGQLGRGPHEVGRLPAPPGAEGQRFFSISYYSSFGCPEPCTFCCSPEMTGMRWKCMPTDRLLDDLADLKQRWGFDRVRFHDANWGVMEKRSRAFSEGMLERGLDFWWWCYMQAFSIMRYKPATLELMRDAGLYGAFLGGETGDQEMMDIIGKHTGAEDNLNAAVRMDQLGLPTFLSYIIGYPGESPQSMRNTIDQCRRIVASCEKARPRVAPFRPLPGTGMWAEALELGFQPPATLEDWGTFKEFHDVVEAWPGQIPADVARAYKLFEHYSTLSIGLARDRMGWWERRARRRMARGDFRFGRLEAKAFDVYDRLTRKLDFALVAVGVAAVMEQALTLIGRGGALVVVGMPPDGATVRFDPSLLAARNQRILGSKMGDANPGVDIPAMIEHWRGGRLALDAMVSGRFPFARINDALDAARAGGGLRQVVMFDE